MIQIQTRQAGVLVIASTADDSRNVHSTWGFTARGAERRLIRRECRR